MVFVGALLASALMATTAIAASPEPPELRAEPVFATSASFDVVLSPHASAPVGPGTYQFLYRESSTGACKGAGEKVAPASPAAYEGLAPEEERLTVAGLKPLTEYAVCVVAENGEGKATSSAVSFTTTAAGAPEAPEVAVEDATATVNPEHPVASPATEAVFHGVLNPAAGEGVASEPGVYQFVYRKLSVSEKTCKGAGEKLAPASPAMMLGGPHEEVFETVKGLAAGGEYGVCLISQRDDGQKEVSPSVAFTTPVPPEKPVTKSLAKPATATTAVLEGTLNPGKEAETGWYFAYSTGANCTSGGPGGGETAHVAPAKAKALAVKAELTGLQPHANYKACLLATNSAGEAVPGNEVSFETAAAAPMIVGESASGVTFDAATLEAKVNPEDQETRYQFEYSTKATGEALEGAIVKVPSTPGTLPAAFNAEGEQVSAPTEPLTQDTTYFYRVVAENTKGEKATPGRVEHFNTPPEAPENVEVPAGEITGQTAKLTGVLNPKTPGEVGATYEFLYQQSESECENGRRTSATSNGNSPEAVQADVTGLAPNAKYTVCLRVRDQASASATSTPPVTFTTAPTPILSGEEAPQTDLTPTTATLQANVNPDGSEVSKCTFQYGTSTGYGEEAPCTTAHGEPIGAGTVPLPVNAHLAELTANQKYHWRLTATNAAGTTTTLDHTFVYSTEGGGLPDGRQYELVTPAEKNGALIGGALNGGIGSQVADQGARVMSFSLQCFGGSPSCEISNTERQGVPVEFARGPSGWVTHPLAPSAESSTSGTGPAYSANVDTGEVLFQTPPPGASGSSGELDWLTEQDGSFSSIGPVAEPGNPTLSKELSAKTVLAGSPLATPSFSHLVYESFSPLWRFDPNSKPFEEKNAQIPSVYEYEGFGKSEPRLVALAPGSSELVSGCGAEIGGENRYNYGALAEDGETVYFEALPCTKNEEKVYGLSSKVAVYTLFARYENSRESARSELISAHAGEHPIAGEACNSACQAQPVSFANFEGASTDGSRVFFTDPHQLTDGASEDTSEEASSSEKLKEQGGHYCKEPASGFTGCNLYESECPDHCRVPAERRLVDISAGDTSGEGPRVLATVAISKDGSHTYFVAEGVLTGANREGHTPADGEPNLYVYERDASAPGGRLSFVATLDGGSQTDSGNWNPGGTFGVGDANVTPDGRFLVFMSQAALTPDDTRTEANPPNQIYRYDAETGTLQRVSIGAKGFRDDGNEGVAGTGTFGNTGIVEAGEGLIKAIDPLRTDPTMSDDGRFVFFHSPIGLTPHAANDVQVGGTPENPKYAQNIYEWEAPGTEVNGQIPCTEPAGCVFLISDGKDVAESDNKDNDISNSVQLLGSSGTGANVFFTTSDELVPQDTDTERDFYDAHICSSEEPCPPPPAEAAPPCLGEVCHGIPAATPSLLTPGSASFNGAGNVGGRESNQPSTRKVTKKTVKCKKGFVKNKKGKCIKQPKKKKTKAKKSAHINRGASR